MAGQNGFQHEMHHQSAQASLIEPVEIDGADRAASRDQGVRDGAALRGDEIARGTAREIVSAGNLREVGRNFGSAGQRNSRG